MFESALPPASETQWPVNRATFLTRLQAYQREVMYRAVILLAILVVGSIGFIAAGYVLFTRHNPLEPFGWMQYGVIIIFGVFLLTTIYLFIHFVYYGPLRKFGLRCGACKASLLEGDAMQLAKTGVCQSCGAILVRDAASDILRVQATQNDKE